MIKLTINEYKLKKIVGDKSFDPIRVLFNLEDNQFNELILDDKFKIKPLFMLNELYPNGLINYVGRVELRKTCILLEEITITYHMIVQNCKNEDLQNLLEDIRLSIQNFLVSLNFKSYYVAFTELRKILEGVIWIQAINEDQNNLEKEKINDYDQNTYNKLISKYAPTLKKLWNLLSNLIHVKNPIICFNINDYYKNPDYVYKIVLELQKTSQTIYEKLNIVLNFFSKSNEKLINRYQKMIKKLHLENEDLKLIDQIQGPDFPFKSDLETQELLIKIFEKNEENWENKSELISRYREELLNINEDITKIMNEEIILKQDSLTYINKSLKYLKEKIIYRDNLLVFQDQYFLAKILQDKLMLQNRRKNKDIHLNEILPTLIEVLILLFEKELKFKGDIQIAILRSIIEEFIFSLWLGKLECYPFLTYISEFFKKIFPNIVNNNPLINFPKYRHIQKKDRILYHNDRENRATGSFSNMDEVVSFFLKEFINLANNI